MRLAKFISGLEGAWRVTFSPVKARRRESKNRALYAHLRDIARHRLGFLYVPEREIERVKADFKRTDIWPRYADAEPDYFTGEVLYRPKSCRDLTDAEVRGILAWLEAYMTEHGIVSHAPADNWQA